MKCLNSDLLLAAAHAAASPGRPEDYYMDPDHKTAWLQAKIRDMCDLAMPQASFSGNRRSIYWWTPEIEAKSARCLMARLNFQRARRRRTRSPAREEQLHKIYREAATDLSSAIKSAKTRAWQELLDDVDRDL